MLAIALLFFSHHQSSEQFDFLYSSRAISGNMDVAPFKLDIDELIADYAKVNFVRSFVCYVQTTLDELHCCVPDW